LGGEIRNPEKNIPRGIFISIVGIALLYLAMQTSILGVLPWQQAQDSPFIVSAFVEKLYGAGAARFATIMVLWIAFASVFSSMLGYSRVPYSAALDGNFFRVFGRVHPKKHFPHVSLLFLGSLTFIFALLFKLGAVIRAVLAMRLVIQFIGQAIGLMLLRRRWSAERLPFKMWFYPLPAVISMAGWAALFVATGFAQIPAHNFQFVLFKHAFRYDFSGARVHFAFLGLLVLSVGAAVFFVRARILKEWPFGPSILGVNQ
jgi:amino acid transporter